MALIKGNHLYNEIFHSTPALLTWVYDPVPHRCKLHDTSNQLYIYFTSLYVLFIFKSIKQVWKFNSMHPIFSQFAFFLHSVPSGIYFCPVISYFCFYKHNLWSSAWFLAITAPFSKHQCPPSAHRSILLWVLSSSHLLWWLQIKQKDGSLLCGVVPGSQLICIEYSECPYRLSLVKSHQEYFVISVPWFLAT